MPHSASLPTLDKLPGRIAVTGASGQLGHQLCQQLAHRAIALDIDNFDLTDPALIRRQLGNLRPEMLINAAAYTAVDAAEADAARCLAINRDAVAILAEVTRDLDCPLVQLSTDYVFCASDWPGRPFRETDPIAPAGVYARSKAEAEDAARAHAEHLIVRTCGIYGPTPPSGSRNFVNTMLQLGAERDQLRVVDDQTCCPTYVAELAAAILHLLASGCRGTFHVVNRDGLSWCDFAREIFRQAQIDCQVEAITSDQYGAAAPRPRNSTLDTGKYQSTGGPELSTCRDALASYLSSRQPPTAPLRSESD